jgi:hypothetical protein
LNDKGTNYLALKSPDTLAASNTWVLPSSDGTGGQVLTTNGSGTLGWASGLAPTGVAGGDLGGNFPNPTVANVGGVTAANVAAGANLANAATNVNTASMIVKRDGSGNFTAGTITGNLAGNVTGNVTGTATNVTGTVAVANGGTGATTLASNNVLLGNGTNAPLTVAPGTSGNVLMSNGTTWASSTPTTNWATPGAIGATTANSAAFTSLTASGNVGIGTTAPSSQLHVAATLPNSGPEMKIENLSATAASAGYRLKNTVRNWGLFIRGDASNILAFQDDTASAIRMAIDSNGNVGIGTTAPSAVLEVAGNVKFGCPTGMVDSGAGFCIDSSDSTEGSAGIALTNCANAAKELCNFREYCTAYIRGIGSLGGSTPYRVPDFVWFAAGSGNWMSATGSLSSACTGVGVNPAGNPQAYRCCRYRG